MRSQIVQHLLTKTISACHSCTLPNIHCKLKELLVGGGEPLHPPYTNSLGDVNALEQLL